MTVAATLERTPSYGGRLRLSFPTVEAALASLKPGDTITIHVDR